MKAVSPLIAGVILIALTMAISGLLTAWITSSTQESIVTSQQCSSVLDIKSTFIESPISDADSIRMRLRNKGGIELTDIKASIIYSNFSKNLENIPITIGSNRVLVAADDPLGAGETSVAVIDVTDKGYPSKIEVIVSECPTLIITQFLISKTISENDFFDQYTVGYWKFDENQGNIATDSSGNGNGGTVNGAIWTSGKSGSALSFDGDNDYVDFSDSDELDLIGAQTTLESWVRWQGTTPGSSQRVIHKEGSVGTGYSIWIGNNRYVWIRWNTDVGLQYQSTGVVKDNDWSHIIVTYDGTQTRIFIDDIPSGTFPEEFSIGANTNMLLIGNRPAGDRPFSGIIDEIRILNISRIM